MPVHISIILRGRHGIGKTETVRQIGKNLNLPVIERRFSQITEGDLLGLPFIEGEATVFKAPEWFVKAQNEPCLLFLDEFDRSSNEVKQAGMELILDRCIQGKKIHPETRIFAAINGGKHGKDYDVGALDPAIQDRFWIADIEASPAEWILWADENVHEYVHGFIANNQTFLDHKGEIPNDYAILPSRRSWDRLSQTMKNIDKSQNMEGDDDKRVNFYKGSKAFREIVRGFVGTEATNMFLTYVKEINKYVTGKNIIDSYKSVKRKIDFNDVARLNYLIDEIVKYASPTDDDNDNILTKKQMKNIVSFFNDLSAELKSKMHEQMSRTRNENSTKWTKLVWNTVVDLIGNPMENE
jgi:hypothetical protein